MSWKHGLLLILVLVMGHSLRGQTLVSGNVSGEWTVSGSPYIAVGQCTVTTGATLIIDPGVRVAFNGYFHLISYGTLVAEGTASDSIVFTSNLGVPNPGDWEYVGLINSYAASSRFAFCDFSYGYRGIYAQNTTVNIHNCTIRNMSGRGIYSASSSGEIQDCVIMNAGRGMKVEGGTILVDHCSLLGNDLAAISASNDAHVTIQYSNLSDNTQQGIDFTDGASGSILWNTVLRNDLDGISVIDALDSVMVNRNVSAGNLDGLYIRNSVVRAWNNTITQNSQHGVFFFGSTLTLGNCIVDRNENTGVYDQSSSYWFFWNDVWDNTVADYEGCLPGAGCFSQNPAYVNASSGGNGDYHLQDTSSCIDAGAPFSPPDPDGTTADVGVFYFDQNHPPVITSFSPLSLDTVGLDQQVVFWISAYDPDGDSLRYEWWHQEVQVGTDSIVTIQFTVLGYQRVVGKVLDGWGGGADSMVWQFVVVDLGVPTPRPTVILTEIWLGPSYPNPFNESMVIPFRLPHQAKPKITVYDVLGREVAVLFDQWTPAGEQRVLWNAAGFPSGIYYIILRSSNSTRVQKAVRLR
jgi:hypothetical protein